MNFLLVKVETGPCETVQALRLPQPRTRHRGRDVGLQEFELAAAHLAIAFSHTRALNLIFHNGLKSIGPGQKLINITAIGKGGKKTNDVRRRA